MARGRKTGGGSRKGTPNKITRTVKEAFEAAFRQAQDLPGVKLEDWMKDNPTDFYKIAAKLIPTELKGEMQHNHAVPSLGVVASALGIQPQSAIALPKDAGHTPAPNTDKK